MGDLISLKLNFLKFPLEKNKNKKAGFPYPALIPSYTPHLF
jgi:hypothetical protein